MGRPKILLVEDDRLAGALMCQRLEAMGYVATHVLTAAEGMDAASSLRPDLILMDVGLGDGIDGIACAGAIRRALDMPIVFLTMRTDTVTITRAELVDDATYLQKSCSLEELRLTIENALEDAERKRRERFAAR